MSGKLDGDGDTDDDHIEEIPINDQLQEVLEFYQCEDLLPFVQRIVWLNTVREALGYIPVSLFKLSYEEITALTILVEEGNKKLQHDGLMLKRESRDMRSKASSIAAPSKVRGK